MEYKLTINTYAAISTSTQVYEKMTIVALKITAVLIALSSVSQSVVHNEYDNATPMKPAALYPYSSETREVIKLDDIWNFRAASESDEGDRNRWYLQDLLKTGPVIPMPVPSSYNDVGVNVTLRDHVGIVWYDRRFFVPSHWADNRTWLRFSSVHYKAQIYINGQPAGFHEIGHLPFEADITDLISLNKSNLLTVAVDNRLDKHTVPQGDNTNVHKDVSKRQQFDFFNYAGVHRSVYLYSTPRTYISDIIVNTDVQGLTGLIDYNVTIEAAEQNTSCSIQLYDKMDNLILTSQKCIGLLTVPNVSLWWPYLMHDDPGYLYTLEVTILASHKQLKDKYSQKIGIRTIKWTNTSIYINDKPLYLRGFGMHEDSDLRGKGWDSVLWVKNFNLIKWIGANAFRTSHYPYAEEIYQLADSLGIMIIDECPSVKTDTFDDILLQNHKKALTDLIIRDKNHPSVIMWSIANEPFSEKQQAGPYFKRVVDHVKSIDSSRPVTIAIFKYINEDQVAQHLDIISVNRYNGWYLGPGELNPITNNVIQEVTHWHRTHNKPVLMSEYGGDSLAGLHFLPKRIWSEEYQVALMAKHFKAFDILRNQKFFIGEFIWNFADFNTVQRFHLVGGNRKGIFTRNREPKESAYHLRDRYLALAAAERGIPSPSPKYYVSDLMPLLRQEL